MEDDALPVLFVGLMSGHQKAWSRSGRLLKTLLGSKEGRGRDPAIQLLGRAIDDPIAYNRYCMATWQFPLKGYPPDLEPRILAAMKEAQYRR